MHTPGPWEVMNEEHANVVLAYRKAFVVADVCLYDRNNIGPKSEEEAEANVRLIAAAPDMLKALESTLDTVRYYDKNYDERDSYIQGMAAIAKAKGQTP